METSVRQDIVAAVMAGSIPDIQWAHGDDLCDCTFQRIGQWTNPYLAETLEVRVCCIWAELYKQYPQFVREVPAYWDDNAGQWVTAAAAWNGEAAMPKALWHRQLSRALGVPVEAVRGMGLEPPLGKLRTEKPTVWLPWSGEWVEARLGQ